MPLKRAPEARAEAALGRQVHPARGSGEGPLDSPAQMVMTPCLLPQEEQSGHAGKAEGRRGGWLCCVGRSGSPGAEVGEGVGSREQGTQTHHWLCVKSHPTCTPQEKAGGGGGQDASLRLFWPSLYLTVSVSQCLLQPHKSNIPSGRCRAVIKRPAPGELDHHWRQTGAFLSSRHKSGQEGTVRSPRKLHQENSSGRRRPVNPRLHPAAISTLPSLDYANIHILM